MMMVNQGAYPPGGPYGAKLHHQNIKTCFYGALN